MVCLIKSQHKENLKHYADILGSEEAAYYVLAMNNGYTLDKTPDGEVSSLYDALLTMNSGDEVQTVILKSVAYMPDYFELYGDWTDGFDTNNGSVEPAVATVLSIPSCCDNNAILSILNSLDLADLLSNAELSNMLLRDGFIRERINTERETYIESKLNGVVFMHPYGTPGYDQEEHELRIKFGIEYDKDLRDKAIQWLIDNLVARFDDVQEHPMLVGWVGRGEIGALRAKLLNNLLQMLSAPGTITGNKTEEALAAVSLIHAHLSGMPADSVIYPIAVLYLRLMYDSKELLDAFKLLESEDKNASPDSMIDTIAKYITDKITISPTKTKLRTAISKIVEKLINFVRYLTPFVHTKDYNARRNMLDAITAFFTANENLTHSVNTQLLYDINIWKINDLKLEMTEMKVIRRMRDGIKSRIKSVQSVQSNGVFDQELTELEEWLHTIDDLLESTKAEDKTEQLTIIRKFLVNAIIELQKASLDLAKMLNNPADLIDSLSLMHIKTDVVGFYENIVNQYIVPLARNSEDAELQPGGLLYNAFLTIGKVLGVVKNSFNYQLERFCDNWVDKMVDDNVDVGDVELFRMNCKLWLRNRINNGDLAILDKYIGSGISCGSPIVRMLDLLLREINLTSHQEALQHSKKLLVLYEKAKPLLNSFSFYNFMNEFIERDHNGKRTGNFVSAVNHGEFERRKLEVVNELNEKYGIELDEYGHEIFEDDDQWRQYNDELDRKLESIGGHKKYKADYYITRRKYLSRDTIKQYDRLRDSINKILQMCTETIEVNGVERKVINTAKLTPDNLLKLRELRTILAQMSNPYDVVFDPNTGRVVSIKLKTGDALRMANELKAWSKVKREHIKYTDDVQKFNDDRAALVQKYGATSREVAEFDYNYQTSKISDLFYEDLTRILGKRSLPKHLQDLLDRRSALKNLAYRKRGYYMPDLDLLSDDVFDELRNLDLLISDEFANLGNRLSRDLVEALQLLQSKPYVIKSGSNEIYYNWLRNNSGLTLGQFDAKYTYRNAKGEITPLSIFLYVKPNNPVYIINTLSGPYSDVDELGSDWVDLDYDDSDNTWLLPDRIKYHNPQYDKITKKPNSPVMQFYEELLRINDMIWDNLDGINRPNRYQMPQRRAASNRLIFRNGVFSNIKSIISNAWSINERDTDYNEEFARRPDGSIVETIPLRWISKLDDPNTIDSNIIQSLADMLEMSILYKYKKQILPALEAINFLLFGAFSSGDQSKLQNPPDLADRFRTHMSMYMYGRMRTGWKRDKKITGFEKFLARLLLKLNAVAHAKLMVHNIRSVFKNFIDSTFSIMAEVNSSKHFSYTDLRRGLRNMGKELGYGGGLAALGRVKVPIMTAALMLYNKVSGSINEIFEGLDVGWIRRIISNHWCMGEYTAIDYTYKGLITEMVYSSYRLMTNPNTGKQEYLNRELALYAYVKAGFNAEDGLKLYNKTTETLRDAYEIDKYGMVKIKDAYVDYVTPVKEGTNGLRSKKLELRVATTIQERAAIINGVLDLMDKNAASQNYVGATLLLMRGWLVSQQIDYHKSGHDMAVYADDDDLITKDGLLKKLTIKYLDGSALGVISEDPRYKGQFNFGTGTVDSGPWVGLLNAYVQWTKGMLTLNATGALNKMNTQQRMQVRRMNACILSVLILCAETFMFGSLWEDDPDNWVYAFLYNGALAAITERFTQLGPIGLMFVLVDIIRTPAVASALILDLKYIPAALHDIAKLAYDKVTGAEETGDMYATVNSGSLKGVKNWQKDLLKASSTIPYVNQLGLENLYKSTSIPAYKSSTNWYGGVAPNPMLGYIPRFNKNSKVTNNIYSWLLWDDDEQAGKTSDNIRRNNKSSVRHN